MLDEYKMASIPVGHIDHLETTQEVILRARAGEVPKLAGYQSHTFVSCLSTESPVLSGKVQQLLKN